MKRFRPGNGPLVLIIVLSTVAIAAWVLYWILYLDPHDPTRISAAAGVAAAAATLILAALTWRSVEISREHIEIQRRPILIPDSLPMPPGFQELPEDLKREARERVETLLANASALRARLRNAGGGTALNIRAVLMLRPHDPKVLPKQFSAFEALPIAPGDSREIEMGEGGTLFSADDRVGGIPMGVPEAPGPGNMNLLDRRPRRIARLALTWRDEAGLKHAGFFDLDAQFRWHGVGFRRGIPQDLQDLDEEKGRQMWEEQRQRPNPFHP